MDIKNVRKWCREFNKVRINVHDEQRSGRPSLPESTVARIDEMVRANRRITLEEIEDGLNEDCSHFSVHKIVYETLGYRKMSARWVDKWLKEAAESVTTPELQKWLGNVTKLRRSRCLQEGEPIREPLPQRIKMEDDHRPTVSGSCLPCHCQRDPSTFSGDGNINPGQWLKEYKRVSKITQLVEKLEDAFRGVFGLQKDSARRAEEVLKSRALKAEESSESYIQEILILCHQVDPRMEEGEIVAHIIK
ncbi:hypothetical protein LAZ67_6003226 [Cordylochernes scorpioides]|uniref:Uncharacterized protein n=1 Tax=Cordylochernes scorpioides TaxID=51811 RepID=A0ABY6KNH8_9ARAC|nr:hypothetical protein LAZ67_6003226 [Cordylochernes scorpioides]